MNINKQIHDPNTKLDLSRWHNTPSGKRDLCTFMRDCPSDNTIESCADCIGQAPMGTLYKIQPNLNMGNLESALEVWRVLLK